MDAHKHEKYQTAYRWYHCLCAVLSNPEAFVYFLGSPFYTEKFLFCLFKCSTIGRKGMSLPFISTRKCRRWKQTFTEYTVTISTANIFVACTEISGKRLFPQVFSLLLLRTLCCINTFRNSYIVIGILRMRDLICSSINEKQLSYTNTMGGTLTGFCRW